MKKIVVFLFLSLPLLALSQGISHYNQYPVFNEQDFYIDGFDDDISFAYSFRKLYEGYTGNLVRLRRTLDNTEKDFTMAANSDLVDLDAITTWAQGTNLLVTIWYDQSNSNRNAVQPTRTLQPFFYIDNGFPYFQGKGTDYLYVENGSLQVVTNAGKNGSIITVLQATDRNQYSFGNTASSGSDNRWSGHGNWSNDYFYFDSGDCCYSRRSFYNKIGLDSFLQYTFVVGDDNVLMRQQGIVKQNGYTGTGSCSITSNFGIGTALNASSTPVTTSTTRFTEFIMYKTDIDAGTYEHIEHTQIVFWDL